MGRAKRKPSSGGGVVMGFGYRLYPSYAGSPDLARIERNAQENATRAAIYRRLSLALLTKSSAELRAAVTRPGMAEVFWTKKEREADEEFSSEDLEFIYRWKSLSESQKREFLKRLIKLTNWWRAEPDRDYGFCFGCVRLTKARGNAGQGAHL